MPDKVIVAVLAEHPTCEGHVGVHYHIDPYPRFCCDDRYVVFATTVLGAVDVAIVPVGALRERT